jgi:hypothetical protein
MQKVLTEEDMLSGAEVTACGYLVVLFEQYKFWQGVFIDKAIMKTIEEADPIATLFKQLSREDAATQVSQALLQAFLDGGLRERRSTVVVKEADVAKLAAGLCMIVEQDYLVLEGTLRNGQLSGFIRTFPGTTLREGRAAVMSYRPIHRMRMKTNRSTRH